MKSSFNPNARWDRHIPGQDDASNPDTLNEPIEVAVWFKQGKLYPKLFLWNNKQYAIKEITYRWQELRGTERISYFSVSTGSNLYQISFNNTTFGWRIDKVLE